MPSLRKCWYCGGFVAAGARRSCNRHNCIAPACCPASSSIAVPSLPLPSRPAPDWPIMSVPFDPLALLPLATADLPGIGGRIKQFPEDFEVEEIPAYEPSGEGDFLYLWIEKR